MLCFCVTILLQVAGALEFLHKSNVIYRDLKPDNILIFSLSTIAKVGLEDIGALIYHTVVSLLILLSFVS